METFTFIIRIFIAVTLSIICYYYVISYRFRKYEIRNIHSIKPPEWKIKEAIRQLKNPKYINLNLGLCIIKNKMKGNLFSIKEINYFKCLILPYNKLIKRLENKVDIFDNYWFKSNEARIIFLKKILHTEYGKK